MSSSLQFLSGPGNELASAIADSRQWMTGWTKTRDDQDPHRPYRPMPERPYLKVMHEIWLKEAILFVEKSRSMLCSWWGVAGVLHAVMGAAAGP
jgi:hypothetical protein